MEQISTNCILNDDLLLTEFKRSVLNSDQTWRHLFYFYYLNIMKEVKQMIPKTAATFTYVVFCVSLGRSMKFLCPNTKLVTTAPHRHLIDDMTLESH